MRAQYTQKGAKILMKSVCWGYFAGFFPEEGPGGNVSPMTGSQCACNEPASVSGSGIVPPNEPVLPRKLAKGFTLLSSLPELKIDGHPNTSVPQRKSTRPNGQEHFRRFHELCASE